MKSCNEMAESVISRRDEYVKHRKKQRTVIGSAALSLAIIVGIGLGISEKIPHSPAITDPTITENTSDSTYVNKEDIHVNSTDRYAEGDMDVQIVKYQIDGFLQSADEDTLEDFSKFMGINYEDFTKKFPEWLTVSDFYALFLRNGNGAEDYGFHDYIFELSSIYNEGKIKLAVSPFGKPARDCFLSCDDPASSYINGHKLIINSYGNMITAEFEYDGLFYDIESTDISLDDLIIFLNSII